MLAIDKKLWRELWGMRMQAMAIALVIVSGVSIFIMSLSTLDSLYETRESYYRQHQFADVFATLKRAPNAMVERIRQIEGIEKLDTRVVAYVNVNIVGFNSPVSAHLLSLPDDSRGHLNRIYLREGRLLQGGREDEILLSEEFANAHRLGVGDKLYATINGRRKALTIVGLVLSPEYIYQIAPGAMFPDYQRYGVMWMAHKPLATAYDMDGAFNHVALTLTDDANIEDVIDRLDELLKPYGGHGAYARDDQLSNRFLTEELKQQKTIATVFPMIFFSVAAFLLNVVISRLISLQREEIATLKAFGYSNMAVGWHYIKLVLMIVAVGVAGGIAAGIWMGKGMSNLYTDFYSFPFMLYVLKPQVVLLAAGISAIVAVAGTIYAVLMAARQTPAEGMRPEAPAIYHATLVERMGIQHWFSQPSRMILRHLERRPLKSMLTLVGIAMACGIMMIGGFQRDAIDYMIEVQMEMSQRDDLTTTFTDPVSIRSMYSLSHVPGVRHLEGYRSVPVRLSFQHRQYRTSIEGVNSKGELLRLLDARMRKIDLPEAGVVMTDYLAKILKIRTGDELDVEILEGNRKRVSVKVVGIVKQFLGVNVYMRREALNRLLSEDDVINGAYVVVEDGAEFDVYAGLREMPLVAGVVEKTSAIRAFYDTLAETVLFFTFISTLLGGTISFGVVYNSMRIALSERSRELASMRVLGFTRGEIAYILLGELGLLTLLAIPLGFLVGYMLCWYLANEFQTDLYRIPLVIQPDVYAFAASVVLASSLISALMIWRNLSQLDMVAVLKTRE